jgi:hypothetical protein
MKGWFRTKSQVWQELGCSISHQCSLTREKAIGYRPTLMSRGIRARQRSWSAAICGRSRIAIRQSEQRVADILSHRRNGQSGEVQMPSASSAAVRWLYGFSATAAVLAHFAALCARYHSLNHEMRSAGSSRQGQRHDCCTAHTGAQSAATFTCRQAVVFILMMREPFRPPQGRTARHR